jgi:hypothetical protein
MLGAMGSIAQKLSGSGLVAESSGSGQGLIYPNNSRAEQKVIGKRRTAGSFCEGTCIFQMAARGAKDKLTDDRAAQREQYCISLFQGRAKKLALLIECAPGFVSFAVISNRLGWFVGPVAC